MTNRYSCALQDGLERANAFCPRVLEKNTARPSLEQIPGVKHNVVFVWCEGLLLFGVCSTVVLADSTL